MTHLRHALLLFVALASPIAQGQTAVAPAQAPNAQAQVADAPTPAPNAQGQTADAPTPAPNAQPQAADVRELSVAERTRYAAALAEASALLKERRTTEAVIKLDALLAQRPREPQARFLRANADADLGKTDQAVAALRSLVADYPELPEPWNNLAVIHAQKDDYESARVALEAAVQAAPNWSVAHENLGDVHARLAAAAYDQAARGDRNNKTAAAKLASIREMFSVAKPPAR